MTAPNVVEEVIDWRPALRVPTSSGKWDALPATADELGWLGRTFTQNGDEAHDAVCRLPRVIARLAIRKRNGRIARTEYLLDWPPTGERKRADYAELSNDETWIDAPIAMPSDPKLLHHIASAIRQLGEAAPLMEGAPCWQDGDLWFPLDDDDNGLDGYGVTPHDELTGRQAWRRIAELCARNPKIALTAGACFGGCYVTPLERRAFIFHLFGDTSEGKSTALAIAAAVMGDVRLVLESWNKTGIGVGRWLGRLRVLCAVIDELGAAGLNEAQLEALMMRLAEGAEREGGTRGGGTAKSGHWAAAFISSGNRGLANVTDNPGLQVRVIDVPGPITASGDDAVTLAGVDGKSGLAQLGAGWPLRWLIDEPGVDHMAALVARAEADLALDNHGPAGRVGRHLALCVAGAARLGWLAGGPSIADQMYQAALAAALDLLDTIEAKLAERGRMGDQLLDVVVESIASFPALWPDEATYRAGEDRQLRAICGVVTTAEGGEVTGVKALAKALQRLAREAGIPDIEPAVEQWKRAGRLTVTAENNHGKRRVRRARIGGVSTWVYDVSLQNGNSNTDRGNRGNRGNSPASGPLPPVPPPEDRGNSQKLAVTCDVPPVPPVPPPDNLLVETVQSRLSPDELDELAAGLRDHAQRKREHERRACEERTAALAERYDRPALGAVRQADQLARRLDVIGRRLAALDVDQAAGVEALLVDETPATLAAVEVALDRAEAAAVRPVEPAGPPPAGDQPPEPAAAAVGSHRPARARRAGGGTDAPIADRRQAFAKALSADKWPEPTAGQVAAALARLEDAVGLTYGTSTPAVVGVEWLCATEKATVTLEREPEVPEELRHMLGRLRTSFSHTDPAQADSPGGAIVQADGNATYPNAAQSLPLGDQLRHAVTVEEPTREQLRRPGFVTVVDPAPDWPAPYCWLQPGDPIITAAALDLAGQLGELPALGEAIFWPDPHARRWLGPFARRYLTARSALLVGGTATDRMAHDVLKAVGAAALGGMLSSAEFNHSRYCRLDWGALVRGTGSLNIWRHFRTASPAPAAVSRIDSGYFIVPAVGDLPAMPPSKRGEPTIGTRQPGKFKVERWALLDDDIRQAIRDEQPDRVAELVKAREVTR